MARQKSALRRRLNYRWFRWRASRVLIGGIPWLSQLLNFYNRGVRSADLASDWIEDAMITTGSGLSAGQLAFIRDRCRAFDSDPSPSDGSGRAEFVMRTMLARDVEVLGHTGAVVSRSKGAIVWNADTPPNWNMAKPRLLRNGGRLRERAVTISGTDHYFHFLMNDMLPLVDYLDRLNPADRPLTVVVPRRPPPFTFSVLEALCAEYPGLRVERLPDTHKLAADELLLLERRCANREWFVWDPDVARRLQAILARHLPPPHAAARAGERLFVTRDKARIRRLENEAELQQIARRHGFEVFAPNAGNLGEQIVRFHAARHIVAVHGAALTNLLWCRPGASVLEIFPENFTKSTFLWLADRLGGRHRALLGTEGDYEQAFSVSAAAFERELEAMLATAERAPA